MWFISFQQCFSVSVPFCEISCFFFSFISIVNWLQHLHAFGRLTIEWKRKWLWKSLSAAAVASCRIDYFVVVTIMRNKTWFQCSHSHDDGHIERHQRQNVAERKTKRKKRIRNLFSFFKHWKSIQNIISHEVIASTHIQTGSTGSKDGKAKMMSNG